MNDMASPFGSNSVDFFNITLTFPIDEKESFNNYIREKGKNKLVELLEEEVKTWESTVDRK